MRCRVKLRLAAHQPDALPGGPDEEAADTTGAWQERLPYRGPVFGSTAMPRNRSTESDSSVPLTRAPSYAASTWGPYYEALHPPGRVHWIVNWKVVPKWIDHAANLWHRRQELRRAYETVHGSDPAKWPVQHPGVLLGFHAACLGCNWFLERGYYGGDGVFQQPVDLARRHEASNGAFRGGDDRLMPAARRVPGPPPVETPPIPRRIPLAPLRIADRYAAGRPRR